MAKDQPYRNRIELLQGTLDMMILRTLQWGAQHGHGIGLAIRSSSQEALQVGHGSLYPALHRPEKQGWIAADWRATESKQRAQERQTTSPGLHKRPRAESGCMRM